MIFYLYDDFEREYHKLDSSTCECHPRIIPFGGAVLLVHNRLADPEDQWEEEEVQEAVRQIQNSFEL